MTYGEFFTIQKKIPKNKYFFHCTKFLKQLYPGQTTCLFYFDRVLIMQRLDVIFNLLIDHVFFFSLYAVCKTRSMECVLCCMNVIMVTEYYYSYYEHTCIYIFLMTAVHALVMYMDR